MKAKLKSCILVLMVCAAMQASGSDAKTGKTTMTMHQDLALRARDIRWPEGFRPETADLFAHNELTIAAPCDRVWRHLVEAQAWPQWYPNSRNVILPAGTTELQAGTVFHWKTFGLSVESRVLEFEPGQRLGWTGGAPGEAPGFYHTWYLAPNGEGCRVVTEEVGKGEAARNIRNSDESLLHRGHDLWLACLRWISEGH
jgi:uncharacterized protein YndB with AHSA1/START domain